MSPTRDEVAERLGEVRERIGDALLVAVTKGFGPEVSHLAVEAGCADIGESYAQDLLEKVASFETQPRWHFIGRLQRNKVAKIAPYVTMWQSVDRSRLIDSIAGHAPGATVLLQVNTTREPEKGGCGVEDFPALVEHARGAGLAVAGVMAVGPTDGNVDPGPAFATARRLREEAGLEHLSIGMSRDLDRAVDEGATIVRVGTAIFGPRPR